MPYIKADQDKFINEKYIRSIQRINDVMEVCVKFNGCTVGVDTIRVSKAFHPESYERLVLLTNEQAMTQAMVQLQKQSIEPLP
jgi:hypothetical protein